MSTIVKTPGVVGGRARIDGSRMPVWTIVGYWKHGMTDEQLRTEMYPWLTQDDLDAVRAYAQAHPEEIERDIADQEDP